MESSKKGGNRRMEVKDDSAEDIEANTPAPTNDYTLSSNALTKSLLTALDQQHQLDLTDEEDDLIYRLIHQSTGSVYGVGASTIYVWQNPRLVPLGTCVQPDTLSKIPVEERHFVTDRQDSYANVDLVGALWTTRARTPPTHAKATDSKRSQKRRGLHWITLSSVVNDPDQATLGPCTEIMMKAGLDKATGVKFDAFGIRGMVVFYAEKGADETILMNPATETYMCRYAYFKGTMLAAIKSRKDAMSVIHDHADLKQSATDDTYIASPSEMAQQLCSDFRIERLRKEVVAWLKKTTGAGAQLPSSFTWKESIWTAVGTFLGLLVIAVINKGFRLLSDEEHFLVLGPFGALMMLQYGLTGSPAGQPRTVIVGHAIAGSIALGLTYIPEEHLAIWLRQILSVTLANFAMVKLGVACPPASAHSLIYAEGEHDWKFWGLALLGCLLSFIPAIFFNNLNPERQYPSFWGYAPAIMYKRFMNETQKGTVRTKKAVQFTEAVGEKEMEHVTEIFNRPEKTQRR